MPGIMTLSNDSTKKTLFVALVLCLVSSIVVASAAVFLKPLQTSNRALNRKQNILEVADLMQEGANVNALYDQYIEARIVELETGEYTEEFDPLKYDQRKAAKDPELGVSIAPDKDIAGVKSKARYAPVYFVKKDDKIEALILPVHGYGLWSTLYGFLALEPDTRTVVGLKFYEHAETPGLGGEVDNPKWRAQWRGKVVYDEQWEPDIELVKGTVDPSKPESQSRVDGLAGATLTARGVTNLLKYWLSEEGFGPFLARFREQGGESRG